MESLLRDAGFAVRQLRRRPGFTLGIVAALAIGIGFNTAVFSFVESILLRPLPLPEPDRLVGIWDKQPSNDVWSLSAPEYLDLKEQSRSFEAVSGFVFETFALTGRDVPEALRGVTCDRDFFRTIGSRAALGRLFDTTSAGGEAVLSHGAWARLFGMELKAIGSSIILNGQSVEIVGILPNEYQYPPGRDVWVSSRTPAPLSRGMSEAQSKNRGWHYLPVIGRLRNGVSLTSAASELHLLGAASGAGSLDPSLIHRAHLKPFRSMLVGDVESTLWLLMGVVAGVLLIACLNIAALHLSFILGRRQELALRVALGASKWQIARQVLVEGLVLGLAGGGAGLLLAAWGIDLFAAWGKDVLPALRAVSLDSGVLAFTFAIALVSGVGFALLPALLAVRAQPMEAMKLGGPSSTRRSGGRSMLVVAEIGVALALLAWTGLVVRGFFELRSVETGLDPRGLYFAQGLAGPQYDGPDAEARRALKYRELLDAVRLLPGVQAAALTLNVPLSGSRNADLEVEGYAKAAGETPVSQIGIVSDGYFAAMGIPLLAGRTFDSRDVAGAQPVLIVNAAFQKRFFGDRDPLGGRVRCGTDDASVAIWCTIVGVVGNVRQVSIREVAAPELYAPLAQNPEPVVDLVLRSQLGGDALLPQLRRVLQTVLPDQAVHPLRPMATFFAELMATEELVSLLTAFFAVVALGLAMLGVYGAVSHSTAQRTKEFGIRAALGARPGDILRQVLMGGLTLAGGGLLVGVPLALLGARVVRSQVYIGEGNELVILAGAGALLFLCALLACYFPARRATKLDPMSALRYE